VIAYVADTYGRDAGVADHHLRHAWRPRPWCATWRVCRASPTAMADKLSKLIPFEVGMTLEKAMAQEQALRDFVAQNEEVAEIMEMAFKLEGLARNVGKHAGRW